MREIAVCAGQSQRRGAIEVGDYEVLDLRIAGSGRGISKVFASMAHSFGSQSIHIEEEKTSSRVLCCGVALPRSGVRALLGRVLKLEEDSSGREIGRLMGWSQGRVGQGTALPSFPTPGGVSSL
jgi:hypothetical protein